MSEHDSHDMHDNSMDAYREERAKLSRRCTRIFDLYAARKKPLSDRAVRDALGFVDMNSVRPRITEMVKSGLLEEVGDEEDRDTFKRCRLVYIRPKNKPTQEKLF